MPGSLQAVRSLFNSAESVEQKLDFLFDAIERTNDNTKTIFDRQDSIIKMIQKKCEYREQACREEFVSKESQNVVIKELELNKFVTKAQAKIYGFILIAFSIGVGIGTGAIAWYEFAKMAIP